MHPESKPGHHDDRWMVIYPRGSLESPPARSQRRYESTQRLVQVSNQAHMCGRTSVERSLAEVAHNVRLSTAKGAREPANCAADPLGIAARIATTVAARDIGCLACAEMRCLNRSARGADAGWNVAVPTSPTQPQQGVLVGSLELELCHSGWMGPSILVVVGLSVLASTACARGADTGPPPELIDAPAIDLFEDPVTPTAEDLLILERLVVEIAGADPTVRSLAGIPPWSHGNVRPVFWNDPSLPGGVVLIGGSIELRLNEGTSYTGPWPSAGCNDGELRGVVYEVRAQNLREVDVIVDANFERVTELTIGPQPVPEQPGGEPSIDFVAELDARPWYSGPCQPRRD